MTNFLHAVIGGVVIAFIGAFVACNIMFDIWKRKGKLAPEEINAPEISPDVPESALVAVMIGKFIGTEDMKDEMFARQDMGQTVAIEPSDGLVCAPVNGKIEMIFETGHAFGMRMSDGTGLLIHIGVDTVNLKGQGFTVLKKAGDTVKAGEPVVRVDLDVLKKAGYSSQTMIVITEPVNDDMKVAFTEFGKNVKRGEILNR
ncbi:MAG: PTS glucose transporter subunit IIA, partial [Synergistaceae bacterium]|nr:PTS glucose transporter subunit IIA [Synergistaceae bacterium]